MQDRLLQIPPGSAPERNVLKVDYRQALTYLGLLVKSRDSSGLTLQEQTFLQDRFGHEDNRPSSLRAVAKKLSIGIEEAREIETEALSKLGLLDARQALFTHSPLKPGEKGLELCEVVDVVLEVRNGNADAFLKIYETFRNDVAAYVSKRVGDLSQVDDIVNGIFIKAFNAFQNDKFSPRPAVPFSAWLFTVAKNEIISTFRKSPKEEFAQIDKYLNILEGDINKPGEEAIDPELLEEIIQIIKRLSPRKQQVIMLRFLQEATVQETAQALNTTENTVKVTTYRALEEIRRLLGVQSKKEQPGPVA